MKSFKLKRTGQIKAAFMFAVSQVFLLPAIAVAVVFSLPKQTPELPQFRADPLNVSLHYDMPQVVTDQQLKTVLWQLRPQLNHAQPKINHVDHALRFWGKEATFQDEASLSGQKMLEILTNDSAMKAIWGDDSRSLYVENSFGPGIRTQEGNDSASHVDHTLGTLSEIGVPLNFSISVDSPKGGITLEALLVAAMRDFRLNQKEYEWTTVAAASFAVGNTSWKSQDGELVSFDLLAQRLMRQQWVQGVCYGNHRLYSLALLLQFDEQVGLFQHAETREQVIAHLQEATARLIASQAAEGFWDQNWPDASKPAQESKVGGPLSRRILATGHAMEWWAIAPQEVQPPREVLVRAGQWLVHEIEKMEPQTVRENYTFLSHAGRALCLWRGHFPHEFTPLVDPSSTEQAHSGAGLVSPEGLSR